MAEAPDSVNIANHRDSETKHAGTFVSDKFYPAVQVADILGNIQPAGATEATLQSVLSAVDQLEGFTDDLESIGTAANALLTTIRDNADQLEGFTDGIEGLLTTIRDNADTVETLLTNIGNNTDGLEGFTDGLETLITSTNTKLDTANTTLSAISGFVDQLEGFLDGVEGLLSQITPSDVSAVTSIASSASNTTLLAANSSRKMFILFNDSNKKARVKFGVTASSTSFTWYMDPGETRDNERWRGQIDAIWDGANGSMRITELT